MLLDNACSNAKVGDFLSQRKGAFAVNEKQLDSLLAAEPKSSQYVLKRSHESFKHIKKWNIFLPLSVINQTWEEPNVNI